jgi:hypothetical protein
MEILISEFENAETKENGYNVTFVNRNKKRSTNDTDFFPAGSDVEVKIGELKKLLKNYFNAQV